MLSLFMIALASVLLVPGGSEAWLIIGRRPGERPC
ncbi:hypothetical protein FHR96_002228 [Halomonas organivorans]|uniref:Uncharacterized protein n=1 Tax=Halomonas organivorans TaxID=257772 RepID=A0A7W5G5P8_9GAMM|nr:hypothetical protein [Halomonas organivorans]